MKNKNSAALLSLLFPGLGHLYIGQYVDAVVFIAGVGVLWYAFYKRSYYLVLTALIFVYLFSIFDAYRKTK